MSCAAKEKQPHAAILIQNRPPDLPNEKELEGAVVAAAAGKMAFDELHDRHVVGVVLRI